MRLDSCRQCVRRRIQCDGQSPQCAKCLKKGLTCSGVGKQYRFVQGHDPKKQPVRSRSNSAPSVRAAESHDRSRSNSTIGDLESCDQDFTLEDRVQIHGTQDLITSYRVPNLSLQPIDAKKRMLFDYFSTAIAPAMVVFDEGRDNGYRSIFLPLAMEDDLVQRAVSVCAAFHLGKKQPEILEQAERDRTAIIQRLRHDSLNSAPDEIFNLSAWATIILLLVAETVTGEHEFAYLFNMLQSLVSNSSTTCKNQEIGSFLIQQTQMFNLFTPLFLGPEIGSAALRNVETQMDFIPAGQGQDAWKMSTLLKQSICLARDMYLARVNESTIDVEALVEKLILLTVSIDEQPGMHAFVWSYFIAAASTKNLGYRSFFVKRLRHIYNKTDMESSGGPELDTMPVYTSTNPGYVRLWANRS